MIAARNGGDPDANPRLRTAITAAKAVSMPNDNIKRAIMRGTGELEGGMIDEFTYEGYGPGGVAMIVEVATDNKNRTVSEIRHVFSKNGGNMGEQGSVAWMFERKGQIILEGENLNEDELMNLVLECRRRRSAAGRRHLGSPHRARSAHRSPGSAGESEDPDRASQARDDPEEHDSSGGHERQGSVKLLDALEEHDDVQNVFSNADIDEKEMEALA